MSSQDESTKYTVATHLSKTQKGGVVIASIGACHCLADDGSQMLRTAVVGDTVEYPDGSVAQITSGAGFVFMDNNHPVAIVGSHVSGGDRIISSHVTYGELLITPSDTAKGFLVEGWMPESKAHA